MGRREDSLWDHYLQMGSKPLRLLRIGSPSGGSWKHSCHILHIIICFYNSFNLQNALKCWSKCIAFHYELLR